MEKHEQTFTAATYACGPSGLIRPHALMGHLQEAASIHAEQLGFGRLDLERIGGYWILSNFYLEITRLPQVYEPYTIRTWPSGNTRLLATREFEGLVSNSSFLFRATSEWMILDRQSGRPKNLVRTNLPNLNTGPTLFAQSPERLQPNVEYRLVQTLQVGRSSLDLNGHVNNTEYVRFAFDALGQDGPAGEGRLQATYLAEVFEQDRLEVYTNKSGQACHVMICRVQEQTPCFLLKVEAGL